MSGASPNLPLTSGSCPSVFWNARASGELHREIRQVEQCNVIGMLPGSDSLLKKEVVIYSAHWDHLGIEKAEGHPAQIFNGAVDNASGAAALLAMAQAAVTHPERRTQIFMGPVPKSRTCWTVQRT